MKMHMQEIGIPDQLEIFTDGMQTVVAVEETLNTLEQQLDGFIGRAGLWPIPLLIVDINMPFNGVEVVKKVKDLYKKLNEKLANEQNQHLGGPPSNRSSVSVLRPLICYLSAQDYEVMSQFMQEDELADCYLEKPLKLEYLDSLTKILNMK